MKQVIQLALITRCVLTLVGEAGAKTNFGGEREDLQTRIDANLELAVRFVNEPARAASLSDRLPIYAAPSGWISVVEDSRIA